MAIKQKITNITGVTTEYHRIGSAAVDYTMRQASIVVLSYLGASKRNEEKAQASKNNNRIILQSELNELVQNPTKDNEARRIELPSQINDLPLQTPEDVEPRNILRSKYELYLPIDTDFTLEFAYGWLKDNVFLEGEDC